LSDSSRSASRVSWSEIYAEPPGNDLDLVGPQIAAKKEAARGIFILGPSVGRPGRLTAYMGGVCGKGPLMTGGCAGAGSGAGIRL
jgi:hypothetical protein